MSKNREEVEKKRGNFGYYLDILNTSLKRSCFAIWVKIGDEMVEYPKNNKSIDMSKKVKNLNMLKYTHLNVFKK